MNRREPKWLKQAPGWFQGFYCNDFYHLEKGVENNRRWLYVLVAAIVGAAIGIIASGGV
jgi:hypothetical protein